jgi:HK97 family phage prohead protease
MKDTFIRAAEFQLRDDGRTLEGCIVPYGKVCDVVELDETNQVVRYREQFLPHSLAAMAQGFKARGGKFVPLLIDHTDTFDNMIGHAVELRSEDDGAYAAFRLYDGEQLLKIRSVLTESHTGLSIGFRDTREPKIIDGIVSRVQVHVGHVAATPMPAYPEAGIVSLRSETGELVDHRPLLSDVRAWLEAERSAT